MIRAIILVLVFSVSGIFLHPTNAWAASAAPQGVRVPVEAGFTE
jgi:hypothetical protein